MAEIVIPFQGRFRQSMLSGRKNTTWRTSEKGVIGDTFWAFGKQFELTAIEAMTQGDVLADNQAVYSEGFTRAWELKEVFDKLYQRAGGYDPDRKGFLHSFKPREAGQKGDG